MHLSFILLRFLFQIDAFLLEMQWSKYANDFKLYSRRLKKTHTQKIGKSQNILSQFRTRLANIYFIRNIFMMLNIGSIYVHCSFIHSLFVMYAYNNASFRYTRWKHKKYINHNRNFSDNSVNRQSRSVYLSTVFCWMNILLKRIMQIINANEFVLTIKVLVHCLRWVLTKKKKWNEQKKRQRQKSDEQLGKMLLVYDICVPKRLCTISIPWMQSCSIFFFLWCWHVFCSWLKLNGIFVSLYDMSAKLARRDYITLICFQNNFHVVEKRYDECYGIIRSCESCTCVRNVL